MMDYKILSIEDSDLISLKEVKNYLRIFHEDDNELLKEIILVGIESAENHIRKTLRTKIIEFNFDIKFQSSIRLPVIPGAEIQKAHYITLNEKVDITKNLYLGFSNTSIKFNDLTLCKNVTVIYKAGYLDQIPMTIKQAVMRHIAEIYDRPSVKEIAPDILNSYQSYRCLSL